MVEYGMGCRCGTTIWTRSLTALKNVIYASQYCIKEHISFPNLPARLVKRSSITLVWYVTSCFINNLIYNCFFQYKWFSTSNKSTCPICRNLFWVEWNHVRFYLYRYIFESKYVILFFIIVQDCFFFQKTISYWKFNTMKMKYL